MRLPVMSQYIFKMNMSFINHWSENISVFFISNDLGGNTVTWKNISVPESKKTTGIAIE